MDNGEFIDISTGAPITGIVEFNKLGELLSFNAGTDVTNQKLSKISRNKPFVTGFEKRTKKFAEPALDKCREISDTVWEEYLDKAMLSIYYAQQSKVTEVKKGCLDFVSQCYESSDRSITAAMAKLLGDSTIVLQPDKVKLSTQLCTQYVDSCNNMFGDTNIITEYVAMRENEDLLSACRAVVKQCFDKFGGSGYENFYYPYSGLFDADAGNAPDWFALYDKDGETYKSPCAQQLAQIASCSDSEMVEDAFGGFDVVAVKNSNSQSTDDLVTFNVEAIGNITDATPTKYGLINKTTNTLRHRELRSKGVATEIYNQIIDTLATQCRNVQGRFIEIPFLREGVYDANNYCQWHEITDTETDLYKTLESAYGITSHENMCPRDYLLSVDTKSWGICSCWENGGRRSKNGRSATCVPVVPAIQHLLPDIDSSKKCNYIDQGSGTNGSEENPETISCTGVGPNDVYCDGNALIFLATSDNGAITLSQSEPSYWCTQRKFDNKNRVCQFGTETTENKCKVHTLVPEGS